MDIEYEATFTDIGKDDVRARLREAGAILSKPEFMMRRVVFELPAGHEINGGWLRVRDEGDKTSMSLKVVDGNKIENQKEICLLINDFQTGVSFLESIGARQKSYQESRRELWLFGGVEVTIDEWPYLEPYVEIEGKNEDEVKEASAKLGFDYQKALFCSVDTLYHNKYGIAADIINHRTPRITFSDPNPFQL